jgi:hypothetical protein
MAWMNQERKATLATGLKKVMPKGWKYSLAVCSTAPMMRCDRKPSTCDAVRTATSCAIFAATPGKAAGS